MSLPVSLLSLGPRSRVVWPLSTRGARSPVRSRMLLPMSLSLFSCDGSVTKGATRMPRSRTSSAHAALAIIADGRKYHARLRENHRGIVRCPLCRDLGCARATQYRLQRAVAMVRSGRQRLPEGDWDQSRHDAEIRGRSDGADRRGKSQSEDRCLVYRIG